MASRAKARCAQNLGDPDELVVGMGHPRIAPAIADRGYSAKGQPGGVGNGGEARRLCPSGEPRAIGGAAAGSG